MQFISRISYASPRGPTQALTTDAAESPIGGSAVFGSLIRGALTSHAAKPSEVANAFVAALMGRNSQWPSAGQTANLGPYAEGVSVRLFRAVRGRGSSGRFEPYTVVNDARNKRGIPYAGFVDQGIRSGGGTVSPVRYAANHTAVARTWASQIRAILATAEATARGRRGR